MVGEGRRVVWWATGKAGWAVGDGEPWRGRARKSEPEGEGPGERWMPVEREAGEEGEAARDGKAVGGRRRKSRRER